MSKALDQAWQDAQGELYTEMRRDIVSAIARRIVEGANRPTAEELVDMACDLGGIFRKYELGIYGPEDGPDDSESEEVACTPATKEVQ